MKAASFSISWYALVISAKGASSCGGRNCPPYAPKNPLSSGTACRLDICHVPACSAICHLVSFVFVVHQRSLYATRPPRPQRTCPAWAEGGMADAAAGPLWGKRVRDVSANTREPRGHQHQRVRLVRDPGQGAPVCTVDDHARGHRHRH